MLPSELQLFRKLVVAVDSVLFMLIMVLVVLVVL